MSEIVTVTIDGTFEGTYYCSADSVSYISGEFINTGSTTIYLYKSLSDHSEYIRLSTLSTPQYYRSYNNTVNITDVTKVEFNLAGQMYRMKPVTDLLLLFIISVFCILKVFIHD